MSLLVKKAQLHYIFSFVFDPIPLGREVSTRDQKRLPLGEILAGYLNLQPHFRRAEWHCSEEDEPLESRSALYINFHHLSISTEQSNVIVSTLERPFRKDAATEGTPAVIGDATLDRHLALFESGMGIITLVITFGAIDDIGFLQKATSRAWLPRFVKQNELDDAGDPPRSIHREFLDEVQGLLDLINLALLAQVEAECLQELRASHLERCAATEDPTTIAWLDRSILWSDDSRDNTNTPIQQEPLVAAVLRIPSEQFESFSDEREAGQTTESGILTILGASGTTSIDAGFCTSPVARPTVDLYPEREFLVFLSGNTLLVVHACSDDSDVLRRFSLGLFRTVCAVRGPWHMYNIVSKQLDSIREDLPSKVGREMGSEEALTETLERIMYKRVQFLYALDVEDPLVRAVGLTPFRHVYDACSETFRLRQLRQLVQYKIQELDNLHRMFIAFNVRKRRQVSARGASGRVKLLLSLVFALLGHFASLLPVFEGRSTPRLIVVATLAFLSATLLIAWLLGPLGVRARKFRFT